MKNKVVSFVTLLVISSCLGKAVCEIFSAISELEKLALNEHKLIDKLKVLTENLNDDYVKRKLSMWEQENRIMMTNVNGYITNPLNAVLMIKHCTSDVELIKKRLPESLANELKSFESEFPDARDLRGAVDGLLRLQRIYRLRTADFANGVIDGKRTRHPLTAHDLYVIGLAAYDLENQDYFVQEYLELARDRLKTGPWDEDVNKNHLLLTLFTSYDRTDSDENASKIVEALVANNPIEEEFKVIQKTMLEIQEKNKLNKVSMPNPYSDYFEKNGAFSAVKEGILYSQVCRGNITQSPDQKSKLFCRYISNTLFAKLAPFKVEELNLDPYIISFVEVLTENEMESLKTMTKSKVSPGKTLASDMKTYQISNIRVAQLAYHLDQEYPLITKISSRIEDMTGLSLRTSESILVQNYGIGGHYVPHWDQLLERQGGFGEGGNRIATMLFYLSDVEMGGATVFPYLKLRIPARKGSAVFWYNLKTSGQSEYFTRHAGCPVLLGSKWVANKWIREHGQEFRRPCIPGMFAIEEEQVFLKNFL